MIEARKFDSVTLAVGDLSRSMRWYEQKFGFVKLYDDAPNSNGVIVGKNGVEICLRQIDRPDSAILVDHTKQVCVQLFALEVDEENLDRVPAEFQEDGEIVVLDGHPQYRSRIVEDPDGHCIELVAKRASRAGN